MPGTILLIEDNEQNRYLLSYLLQRHGYAVVCANDGQQGIQIASELTPSAILLDIQLPAMSGYDVARALRDRAALRHTPIIAVTSYAMPGDREKAMASGCTGYIEKPIDTATFVTQMETFFQGGSESP
jgi:two-component system, cell cycle response regulator DivK